MEETGIIERVTEPKEWCAPRVSVQKSNGKLRICVDLRRLNSAVKLSRLVLPTLEDIAPKLAGTRYFSKLDTSSGLWQIPLHSDTAKFTTFMTPFGRFCFKRLAFGNTSAPESFQYLISYFVREQGRLWINYGRHYCVWKSTEKHDENRTRFKSLRSKDWN